MRCTYGIIIALLIGNALITVVVASDVMLTFNSSDEELKSLVTKITQRIIEAVTGDSISKCVIGSFHKNKAFFGFSGKYTIYYIDANVLCNTHEFKVEMSVLNNRSVHYIVRSPVPLNESSPIHFDSALLRKVIDIVSAWYDIFRDSYLINAIKTLEKYVMRYNELRNVTVEMGDTIMNILVLKSITGWMDVVAIRWMFKVNNIPTYYLEMPWDFSVAVSPQIFAIEINDYRGLAKIRQVDITISKDRAIEIARPIAEKYASQYNVEIIKSNAKLYYVRDVYGTRGDELAMYPCWVVIFLFNETIKDKAMDFYEIGYVVYVLADNGEILHQHRINDQWLFLELPPERGELTLGRAPLALGSSLILIIRIAMIIAAIVSVIIAVLVVRRRKSVYHAFK